MTDFLQIHPVSLRDQVVEQVRTAIIEGRLNPGDHIVKQDLTDIMGVSRTPVREALLLLEQEGLVISYPNRGFFVRIFSEEDVTHIFSMRTMLENFAGELIIHDLTAEDYARMDRSLDAQRRAIEEGDFRTLRRIDMDFHRALVERSQHPFLIRTWAALVAQIAAILYLRAEADPEYDEYNVIRDHIRIVEAYKNRSIEELRAVNNEINERVAVVCRESVAKLKV